MAGLDNDYVLYLNGGCCRSTGCNLRSDKLLMCMFCLCNYVLGGQEFIIIYEVMFLKKSKYGVLLLICVLVLTMLSGCKKNQNVDGDDSETNTTTETVAYKYVTGYPLTFNENVVSGAFYTYDLLFPDNVISGVDPFMVVLPEGLDCELQTMYNTETGVASVILTNVTAEEGVYTVYLQEGFVSFDDTDSGSAFFSFDICVFSDTVSGYVATTLIGSTITEDNMYTFTCEYEGVDKQYIDGELTAEDISFEDCSGTVDSIKAVSSDRGCYKVIVTISNMSITGENPCIIIREGAVKDMYGLDVMGGRLVIS